MFVEMKQNIGTTRGPYKRGVIYEVEPETAADWTRAGYAVETTTPTKEIARLFERLERGADMPCVFMPFVGEFGHAIMSHIRVVHFHKAKVKVVCCRAGEEVLYPSATSFYTDWKDPIADSERVATIRHTILEWPLIKAAFPGHHPVRAGAMTPAQEVYAIHPDQPIPFRPKRRGFKADVVLGIRKRGYAMERNWQHWPAVAQALRAHGLTYAIIGDKATSFDLPGSECFSGDHDTDCAIELLQNCRLCLGSDSGNSHLAATVGAKMTLFRETKSGSRDLTARMQQVNPQRIEVVKDGWNNPQAVIAAAIARTESGE